MAAVKCLSAFRPLRLAKVRSQSESAIFPECVAKGSRRDFLDVSSVAWLHFAWQVWHFVTCVCATVVAESCRAYWKSCKMRYSVDVSSVM